MIVKFVEADDVLRKYNLEQDADEEFRRKTKKDTGKMNVGLRLRTCAEYMEKKARELHKKREEIVKQNPEKCPNFETVLKKNPYSHDDCAFINMVPQKFCYNCNFYKNNVKELDDSINELNEAAKIFRDSANYDDTWQ